MKPFHAPALACAAALLALTTAAPKADAFHSRGYVKFGVHGAHHHGKGRKAKRIKYGPRPKGYWRPGPEKGYGFRFSTYRGDPFGKNDYYDGGDCFYRNGHNFCEPRNWRFNIWR